MTIVLSFSALCLLLITGKLLRVKIRLFQTLYLPASVIAGLLGLLLIQSIHALGASPLLAFQESATAGWGKLPGFLINIVFAALFLGVTIPPLKEIWRKSGPQLAYGQIVAWGQYATALTVAIVVLVPLFSVPGFMGTIVPVGFEGGHGTAGGLEPTFTEYRWEEGKDLALAAATAGILSAIIVGMGVVVAVVVLAVMLPMFDLATLAEK